MQAASTPRRSSPRRRARAVEIDAFRRRNTATICLDGTDFNVLNSYLGAMKDLDEWLRDGTEVVDLSGFFGPGHDIVRTRHGIFNMVFEYEGNLLTVPIEGRNLYLRGFSNEHGNFELDFGDDSKFVHDKRFTVLDIGVNYHDLLDDSLERTLTGLWRMRTAVSELCIFKGGSAKSIGPYIGTIAVHISEAARSVVVHSFICRSIVDANLSRLNKAATVICKNNKEVTGLVIWIRKYSALSNQLLKNIDIMFKGEALHPIDGFGLHLTIWDLVIGLKVCPMDLYTKGIFKIKENGLRGRRDGVREIAGNGLLPHKIQRGLFSTTSSGRSLIERMNTCTEGAFQIESAEDRRPRGTRGEQQLMITSQMTKAETPSIVKQTKLGRLPIELAALCECKEEVKMLLPLTSPIPNVRNWSVDGVISHAKFEDTKPLDKIHSDGRRAMIKSQADLAFRQNDYALALKFYNMDKGHYDRRRVMINSHSDMAFRQKDYALALKFYNMLGRLPVELAALRECMKEVEMLWPLTSPIPNVKNLSADGVISHAKFEDIKLLDKGHYDRRRAMIKSQADLAFRQKDYALALKFYNMGTDIAPEATLYSNRSLCKLRTGYGEGALSVAYHCRMMRPAGQKLAIGKQLLTCYSRSTSKLVWTHKNWILAMMRLRRS